MPWPKKYSASARVETVMPPGWPAIASRATSIDLAVFMCGRSGTFSRARAEAITPDVARQDGAIEHKARGRQVGEFHGIMFLWAVSSGGVVDRQHRARHVPPGKARQDRAGQAGRIDLDDLVMAEEFVEAAAEMAARLHHDDPGGGDVEAERLEEHRVGALVAVGQDDDGDAVQRQRGGLADVQRVVGVDAAPAADRLVAQARRPPPGR